MYNKSYSFFSVYYPRRSQKSMGAMGKKISYFLLTKFTGNCFDLCQNNIIKMWEKIIFLEFAFIILLIEQIFLMSSSDLVSILSTIVGDLLADLLISPYLLCAIPIKSYFSTEADTDKILKENKNKSGIYMWINNNNGKQYIGSAVDLSNRLSFYFSCKAMKNNLKK